jgi:ESCRT-II complex subunit VPS25
VLWKKLEEWAESVHSFIRDLGMQDSVMTVDELSTGDEVRGTGVRFNSAGL